MNWWQRFVKRDQLETELDRELRDHVERQVADQMRNGATEREARRRTRMQFGGLDQTKEWCRDVRGTRWLEELGRDLRYGARMLSPRPDLPQGTLDMLVLQVVAHGPIHGYAIAQRIQQISGEVLHVPQGSLYPALHRLENRTLLASEWKASDTGRDAKFYTLTAKGRTQLKDQTANWARLSEAIALILQTAGGETP